MRRYLPLLLVGFLAAVPGATRAIAQSESGAASIEGEVHGPNGKAVPNASVRITATATGYTRTVATRRDGSFVAPLLPVGHYGGLERRGRELHGTSGRAVIDDSLRL